MRVKSNADRWTGQWLTPAHITLVVVVLCIGLGGCRTAGGMDTSVQRALRAAGLDRDRGQGTIHASGTIQADEIRIAGEFGGRIVDIHAQASEHVHAGQRLVSLDAAVLHDGERRLPTLAEAEAEIATAQADLIALQAGATEQELHAARAALSLAVARRDGAHTAWQNARDALLHPQELDARITEARTQIKLAEQAAILAEAQLAGEQLLARQRKEGSDEREIADWQVKAAEEALAAARADQVAAQTLLDWLTYIRSEPLAAVARVNAAQGEAQIAEAAVSAAQARLENLQAGPTAQEIAVQQARVRLAQAQAGVLRAQVERFALYSPVDGIVLDRVLRPGELAAPAATILTIARLDPLKLTVYVPVNQIGHVYLGQPVQATTNGLPDRAFAGRVTHMGDQPEYTPRNVATQEERLNTFYAVEIHLDNPDHALKPGMPADAVFWGATISGAESE